MKKTLVLILSVIFFSLFHPAVFAINYPKTKVVPLTDNYFGTSVQDSYRWLEEIQSPETKQWVETQDQLTRAYLHKTTHYKKFNQRLKQLWDYNNYGTPVKAGNYYFFMLRTPEKAMAVLYKCRSWEEKPEVVVDPNLFSTDGSIAIRDYEISDDGQWVTYGVSKSGSDWTDWRIRNVESGNDLPEQLTGMKWNGPVWTKDNKGLIYSRYPAEYINSMQKADNEAVYYHLLNNSTDKDQLLFKPANKDWMSWSAVSDDGQYLVLHTYKSSDDKYQVDVLDLKKILLNTTAKTTPIKIIPLFRGFDNNFIFVGNIDKTFFFNTTLNAPNGRVISVVIDNFSVKKLSEIIPEKTNPIANVDLIDNKLIVHSLVDAKSQILIYDSGGKLLEEVPLQDAGTISGFNGHIQDKETFFSFESFSRPKSIYKYDFTSNRIDLIKSPKISMNPNDFVTYEIFFRSTGGAFVPMFITHKKNIRLDGKNPTWLYGYGTYGLTETPEFRVSTIAWMEQGGIYAVPNIRGGGVYGEKWHRDGMLENKQNSFDDFIAAAEWLISNHFTAPQHLVINGGSCGGLLVGAALVQKPSLFGAAIIDVGVLDMLRYHKYSGAYLWVAEFGSADIASQFQYLYKYSPLHNIPKNQALPAVLINTGLNDTRVVPSHSFKFAATLQTAQTIDKPILLRVEKEGGHTYSILPREKQIEIATDKISFAWNNVGK